MRLARTNPTAPLASRTTEQGQSTGMRLARTNPTTPLASRTTEQGQSKGKRLARTDMRSYSTVLLALQDTDTGTEQTR
jgi:hypothetical protein